MGEPQRTIGHERRCNHPRGAIATREFDRPERPPTWGTQQGRDSRQTRVNLAWNASTDAVGVQGYSVFREGIKVGTVIVDWTGRLGYRPDASDDVPTPSRLWMAVETHPAKASPARRRPHPDLEPVASQSTEARQRRWRASSSFLDRGSGAATVWQEAPRNGASAPPRGALATVSRGGKTQVSTVPLLVDEVPRAHAHVRRFNDRCMSARINGGPRRMLRPSTPRSARAFSNPNTENMR